MNPLSFLLVFKRADPLQTLAIQCSGLSFQHEDEILRFFPKKLSLADDDSYWLAGLQLNLVLLFQIPIITRQIYF